MEGRKPGILFITKDESEQMMKSNYYLVLKLKQLCDLTVWTHGGHILDILNKLTNRPAFILLNDMFGPKLCPYVWGLNETNIPKGMIFHDIFDRKLERKKFVVEEKIDYVLPHYRDAFKKWYPEFVDRMIWFPHHAYLKVFKDYKQEKTINWLMMGAMHPKLYPLRILMQDKMRHQEGFVYHPHPGFVHDKEIHPHSLINDEYAREINRAKMFLTCNNRFEYPLLKYFEVLACNTLLLAPITKELEDLGFVDQETMIHVTRHDFSEKAQYYLNHDEERKRIAHNGYRMVRERHSTSVRASQFLREIQQRIQI